MKIEGVVTTMISEYVNYNYVIALMIQKLQHLMYF